MTELIIWWKRLLTLHLPQKILNAVENLLPIRGGHGTQTPRPSASQPLVAVGLDNLRERDEADPACQLRVPDVERGQELGRVAVGGRLLSSTHLLYFPGVLLYRDFFQRFWFLKFPNLGKL